MKLLLSLALAALGHAATPAHPTNIHPARSPPFEFGFYKNGVWFQGDDDDNKDELIHHQCPRLNKYQFCYNNIAQDWLAWWNPGWTAFGGYDFKFFQTLGYTTDVFFAQSTITAHLSCSHSGSPDYAYVLHLPDATYSGVGNDKYWHPENTPNGDASLSTVWQGQGQIQPLFRCNANAGGVYRVSKVCFDGFIGTDAPAPIDNIFALRFHFAKGVQTSDSSWIPDHPSAWPNFQRFPIPTLCNVSQYQIQYPDSYGYATEYSLAQTYNSNNSLINPYNFSPAQIAYINAANVVWDANYTCASVDFGQTPQMHGMCYPGPLYDGLVSTTAVGTLCGQGLPPQYNTYSQCIVCHIPTTFNSSGVPISDAYQLISIPCDASLT